MKLSLENYQIVQASSGTEALAFIEEGLKLQKNGHLGAPYRVKVQVLMM